MKPNGIAKLAEKQGWAVHVVDIKLGSQYNVADDEVWKALKRDISGLKYHAMFASPPKSTFLNKRTPHGDPSELRGISGGDRYG